MRFSIRVWTILVLNVFVVGVALVFGWIAQDVAGNVVEERLAAEMVVSVSGFLGKKTFPLSDSMMGYLREMLDADWVAVEGDSLRVIGSSLPEPQTREFARRVRELGQAGAISLGGTNYRIESNQAPANAARETVVGSRPNLRRLYLLIPSAKFQETRARASKRVAAVVLPATGVATLAAILLALIATYPVRKLTREMDRLASVEDRKGAAQASSVEPATEELSSAELRRSLISRGPVETRRLAKSFYALLDRLALTRRRLAQHERLATLGKVSLSVAHELRNPLSGIKMNMRVLQDRMDSADDPGVAAILREIERMSLYLDELMTFAPGDGRLESEPAPVKLSGLVESVLTLMAGRLRHGRVTVKREFPASEPHVSADGNQIRQVLINLIVNAIEAMPEGGRINISIRPLPSMVALFVSDTGEGVQLSDADAFEPFATGKPNGVGLGLYLSKQIVHRHGGRIGYENCAIGATFWFELPNVGATANEPRELAHTGSE